MSKRPRWIRRVLTVSAWLALALCTAVTVTGIVLTHTRTSVAQEAPPVEARVEAEADTPPAATATGEDLRVEGLAEQVPNAATPPPAGVAVEPGTVVYELVARETRQIAGGVGTGVVERAGGVRDAIAVAKTRAALEADDDAGVLGKAISFLGILALIGVAWLLSVNRRGVNWRIVGIGVGLQLAFALFIFYVPGGDDVFEAATVAVKKLLQFTDVGSAFIFESFVTNEWDVGLINFAFAVLPTIIFFSSLMTILYHLGLMQKVVYYMAKAMQKAMGTSGAETLSATANIFVGQTEAPLVVKPYVEKMTMSELMVVMTGGFATVAGGVLAIYVSMLQPTFPDIAGHLLAASVMSAPAALVIAKIMWPETERAETAGDIEMHDEKIDANVLDAASRGAAEGLKLALNVGAMLLAFLALIAMINYLLGLPSLLWNKGVLGELIAWYQAQGMAVPAGCGLEGIADEAVHGCVTQMAAVEGAPDVSAWPMITLELIFGYVFWPFAWIMGVPTQDCYLIGQLLGEKMVVNELVAYKSLAEMLQDPTTQLSQRSVVIATYALCGFANFGSIGIQLGGIGGIAPSRKSDLAKIALRAMIGGTLAAFMTGTIAGILI